jgi:hypothetical protein
MKIAYMILAASLVAAPFAAGAQSTYKQRHTIAARNARQNARITKGVKDGQITPKGAAAARAHQDKIAGEDQRMREADGGHLTAADRHTLANQQNAASKGIYNRNHNQVTDPGVTPNTPR